MSDDVSHRDFLLQALRAASARAKLIDADITTIGLALKGDLIDPETAVRWIMDSGLLWIVGALPESVGKVSAEPKPRPLGNEAEFDREAAE
jgi:hypothetical protein